MPPVRLPVFTLAAFAILILTNGAFATEIVPSTLTLTTFNIKYFGLNGDPNGSTPESRIDTIRSHMTQENLFSDVIVFEEIVNVEMLENEVLGRGYNCRSYTHSDSEHQHVAICYKTSYKFVKASDDEDFVLGELAMGEDRYRPAVHGILKDSSGRHLLHIVGVHLKAYPECAPIRLQQVEMLTNYLASREDNVPVALLGDFNTYEDSAALGSLLADGDQGLFKARVPGDYTWRTTRGGQKFDHIWLSRDLRASRSRVAGPCNETNPAVIARYGAQVSDHCPVTLTVTLPASTR